MAVAHDAQTRFPATDTTGFDTTTGDRTFTHTPVGTPKGVVVVICAASSAIPVTGVLYGGVPMTLQQSAVDTTEVGEVYIYVLTSSVPSGPQTVTLQGCIAASKFATCSTVTAATATTRISGDGAQNTTTSASPAVAFTGGVGAMIYGGVHGGAAAPTSYAPGSFFTAQFNGDYGALSARTSRSTTVFTTDTVTYNFVFATSDDWCIAAVAIAEAVSGSNLTQNVNDTVSLSDGITVELGRSAAPADSVTLSDAFTFDRTNVIADTVSLADAMAFARDVHLADTVSLADAVLLAQGKTLADTVGIADSLSSEKGFAVAVDDTVTLADALAFVQQKQLSDSVSLSDQLAFERGLVIAETLTLADAIAKDVGMTLADTLSLADDATPELTSTGGNNFTVNVDDVLTLADAIAFERDLHQDDAVSLTDTTAFNREIHVADSLTLADALGFGQEKALADTVSVSDILAFERELLIQEVVGTADALSFMREIHLSDGVALSDAVAKMLNGVPITDAVLRQVLRKFYFGRRGYY